MIFVVLILGSYKLNVRRKYSYKKDVCGTKWLVSVLTWCLEYLESSVVQADGVNISFNNRLLIVFNPASSLALVMSVGRFTTLAYNEISQQLFDGLAWNSGSSSATKRSKFSLFCEISQDLFDGLVRNFVHTFMVHRGWILLTLVTFPLVPPWDWHFWFRVKCLEKYWMDCC